MLMRLRIRKYACVADVSKCFFQIKLPRDQQDWFHIIWFKDYNVVSGEIQIFRFTRHVWGINSSPYVALMALNRLVADNSSYVYGVFGAQRSRDCTVTVLVSQINRGHVTAL